VGSVCHITCFKTGLRNFQGHSKVADDARPDAEMAETTVKRLLCCGFQHTGKAMGQGYQCWWRICREIKCFFQVQILHVLHFISICDLFTDSPSYFSTFVLLAACYFTTSNRDFAVLYLERFLWFAAMRRLEHHCYLFGTYLVYSISHYEGSIHDCLFHGFYMQNKKSVTQLRLI
jgi:hypothetical protein